MRYTVFGPYGRVTVGEWETKLDAAKAAKALAATENRPRFFYSVGVV